MDVIEEHRIKRTYGDITFNEEKKVWLLKNIEPHVAMRLKRVFSKIAIWDKHIAFQHNPENCMELLWFIDRYPLSISSEHLQLLSDGKQKFINTINDLNHILLPNYKPRKEGKLNEGEHARDYQLVGRDLLLNAKRLLIGDDTGLGKTAIAIFAALKPETLPCFICVQTHLPTQWQSQINKFTKLKSHIIKTGPVYTLPPADIYIITYSKLGKWFNILSSSGFLKMGVFDEAQELRHKDSIKYKCAKRIADVCEYVLGLTATPIYNYADEIFHIMDLIKPGSLGKPDEFAREWANGYYGRKMQIKNPIALGTYLRENYLFLRRTRKDVQRELPPVNTIIHTVGYDEKAVEKAEAIAKQLAYKTLNGSFVERGAAARELDVFLRYQTGVSKAIEVAEYVRILLENNEPIILAGWHRDVYDIWLKELAEFNPAMYTGSETPKEKEESKRRFIEGETNLFIISLRSGVGIDGLQHRCNIVVFGELDWSPQVHHQIISRADRDQQKEQVTAIYLVSEYGSDPTMIELNGAKASLSKQIIDPLQGNNPEINYSDDSRIVTLAKKFLESREKKPKAKKEIQKTQLF